MALFRFRARGARLAIVPLLAATLAAGVTTPAAAQPVAPTPPSSETSASHQTTPPTSASGATATSPAEGTTAGQPQGETSAGQPAPGDTSARQTTVTEAQDAAAASADPPAPPGQLGPIDPGPDGSPDIGRGPSAAQPIAPLPALDPGPDGRVPVERVPIAPNPPVTPSPLDLPRRPGQELVDATAAEALATLAAAGRTTPQGQPDLDAEDLQPQVRSAQFIDPTRPATLRELLEALTSGNIPPPLPVDPLALLEALPDGIPRLTYRICSESRTKEVSCTLTLPLAVPAIVDVTGDGTPDVLSDLVPLAAPGDIIAVAREILDLEAEIAAVTNRLNVVLELLSDPLNVILHPELLVEKLQLENLLADLGAALTAKVEALLNLVHLGLGLVNLRLPTSEFAGEDLPAHVWAVYDFPTHKRISVGFDGLRRGAGLPTAAVGVYTFAPLQVLRGIFDIKARLITVGAADSLAITAGLANVTDDDAGHPYDPTVASAQFSPVPTFFDVHAFIDPGAPDRDQKATVDANSTTETRLDVQVLSNNRTADPPTDRFDQLVVDVLPTSVSAALTRPAGGGDATVDYTASDTIDTILFADYVYSGQQLTRATRASAQAVPATWRGVLATAPESARLDYTASSALAALDIAFYDREPAIVLRGKLRELPTAVVVNADLPARHVQFTADNPLGSAEVALSKGLGDYAPLDGEHGTAIIDGDRLGVSARVTGLRGIDVYFDDHPRGGTEFTPGGQRFVAAGVIDGRQKARLDVSNLPASLAFDLDTVARRVLFTASSVVNRVQAAYVDTAAGPSALAAIEGLPERVEVTYDLGERPRLAYRASSAVPRAELFVSPQGVERLDPTGNHYLSAALTALPTEVDVLVDLPARHLDGTMSAPLGGITAVARTPVAGRDYLAIGELTGVPARFDADFADGLMRFRGLTGPLGAARFSVTNHAGATMPAGQHVSAHYRQVTGDFDGSVSIRNLTLAEYARGPASQVANLQLDTDGQPVFVDADVLLAANGVDDTRLAVTARIDNLPTDLTLTVDLADGKITYTGDRSIGLTADVHIGKVAALAGLGAPLFDNGVAVRARGCDAGAGCAPDDTPICTLFERCLGVAGTIRLPGLPTALSVDLAGREIEITGYTPPPGAPLTAYLEVIGLLPGLPRLEGQVELAGLPSNVDLAVGPITVEDAPSRVDVGYRASAPLGTLRIAAEADTPSTLRARASIDRLPATARVTGTFDAVTRLGVHNSAPIDEVSASLSTVDAGLLSASAQGIPADLDVLVDAPASHFESVASAELGRITFRAARVPFQGRQYQVFAEARGIPARMEADWAGGAFAFRGVSGAIDAAAFAVTNHPGATAPTGQHVAAHYRQASGDLDASAAVFGLSEVSARPRDNGVAFDLRTGNGAVNFDGDFVLAADVRYAALGRVTLPSTLDVTYGDGKLSYLTDRPVGLLAEARIGKTAAIDAIDRVPLYAHGIAVEARACSGAGCAPDESPLCGLLGKCFGAVGTVSLPGLPTRVDVDMAATKIDIVGYRPPAGVDLIAYARFDGLFDVAPRTAAMARLRGLPSPFDLHIGPFGFDKTDAARANDLSVEYTASGGVDELQLRAEADTTTPYGTLRGAADVQGVPSSLKVTGDFGANSRVRVASNAPIRMVNAHVGGTYDGAPAGARARLTDIPACDAGPNAPCVDVTVTGTDKEGTPLKVPVIDIVSAEPGLDAEAYVQGRFALAGDPIGLQVNDVFAALVDLGEKVTVTVAPNDLGTFDTRLQSSPGKTGSLLVGGSFELRQNEPLVIEEFEQDIVACVGIPILTLHVDRGHIQAPEVVIDDIHLVVDGFSDMTLTPGKGYVAFGVQGTYDRFSMVAPDVRAKLDLDLSLQIQKFDQPLFPLYEFDLNLSPQDNHTGLRFHVFDMKKRVNAEFQVQLGPVPITVYPVESSPGFLEEQIPADPSLSGITVLPPQSGVGDADNRKFVFTFMDPGKVVNGQMQYLSGEAAQLLDIAVSNSFSPFPPEGDSGGGPC
ncbi:hypothetical protein [Actinokineospora sp. UTMC 2448]|uniref:hypothetical protein n=1 Tax=Actinokineospora sp. UTMC 2448 TaxID=2268449 RepID=UPI002164E28E|nr:hypothetical protein [Actinokineospora sp. UTMC 2448]UVS77513.1 hypothetical protein Actkin_01224 [Actinokineospora sp. UTMC 2448]